MKQQSTRKEDYIMGSNGPKGMLFITQDDDVEILAAVIEDTGGAKHLDMDFENLAKFGISRDKALEFARMAEP
eukprot:7702771-Pyramimonas_sp.AAC.1